MRIQIEGYREMLGLKVIASDVTLGKVQRGVWRSGFKFPSVHKCTLYHTPSLWLGRDTGPLWKLIVVVLLVNYGRFVSSSVIVLTISEVSRIFTSLINYRAWMTLLLAQHQTHIISFEHLTFCWGHTHTRSQTLIRREQVDTFMTCPRLSIRTNSSPGTWTTAAEDKAKMTAWRLADTTRCLIIKSY